MLSRSSRARNEGAGLFSGPLAGSPRQPSYGGFGTGAGRRVDFMEHQVLHLRASRAPGTYMHELDPLTANTPNYRYGFLSAGLHHILGKPVGTELSAEERRQVALGKAFLADVLAGATLVSRGDTKAASPTRAIGVLDYALGPLQAMERLRDQSEETVIRFLEDTLNALDASLAAGRLTGDAETLLGAKEFFTYLSDDILSTLNRTQHERHLPGDRAALM